MATNVSIVAMMLAALTTGGCAASRSHQEASATTAAETPAAPRRSTTIITGAELAETGAQDLHLAIQTLRPNWLRARPRAVVGAGTRIGGASANDQIVVYLDQTKHGGIASLQQLSISGVREIRFFESTEATNRFGVGHSAGAIVVVMGKP